MWENEGQELRSLGINQLPEADNPDITYQEPNPSLGIPLASFLRAAAGEKTMSRLQERHFVCGARFAHVLREV